MRRTTEKSSGAIRESCSQCAENRQFRSLDSDSKIAIFCYQEKRVWQPVYSTFRRHICILDVAEVPMCQSAGQLLLN